MAGLPLILVDREVSELLIPNQTGMFARNNPRNLANTIIQLLSLPADQYQAMSKAVQARAQQFSELEQTRKMIKLFEAVIVNRPAPAKKRKRWF
mgnify:FL=1